MQGDGVLFAPEDTIEKAWDVVQAVLSPTAPVQFYEKGSWGPPAANHFIAEDGGWFNPE